MNKKHTALFFFLFGIVILAVVAKYFYSVSENLPETISTEETSPENTENNENEQNEQNEQVVDVEVILISPISGGEILISKDSPTTQVVVTGLAKGNWFFEANIPVKILDADGDVLAEVGGQAEGDWMTTSFVSFTATLEIGLPPLTQTGKIVISKDNPSGLPEHDKSVEFPVTFRAE